MAIPEETGFERAGIDEGDRTGHGDAGLLIRPFDHELAARQRKRGATIDTATLVPATDLMPASFGNLPWRIADVGIIGAADA